MTTTSTETMQLHIPEGINYECDGCGKCCGGWTVPMTEEDYDRISPVDWGKHAPQYMGRRLFRPMKKYEMEGTPYSYAIMEAETGVCPFLVDNLCFIHGKYGSDFKPSMCQLFPYCFNETPSGIYTTVSFVSMAVVHNTGKSLEEQRDYLNKKLGDFRRLYPDHHPNWSQIKLTTGKPVTWDEYLELEKEVLSYIKDKSLPIDKALLKASAFLCGKLSSNAQVPTGDIPALKPMDKHLLVNFHKMYFPTGRLGRGEGDFNPGRFMYQVTFLGPFLRISAGGKSYTFDELKAFSWPDGDKEIEDLLYRYVYSRMFAKLYFGAGFGQLSIIAGFHHLAMCIALVKLQAKALAKARGANIASYIDVVAAVRMLEKRLGEVALGPYAAAMLELLLFSPGRLRRFLGNS